MENKDAFRFENLEIWKDAIMISDTLLNLSDIVEGKKLYRFAEQLRGATMSISNNIAEGSGCFSNKEFAQFLNFARRSIFECANIVSLFLKRELITIEEKDKIYIELTILSKKIAVFRKRLLE